MGRLLHRDLKERLVRHIAAGSYGPDQPLPKIADLAAIFGASTKTVQKAIHELSAEGVLSARRGKGLFVCPAHARGGRGRCIGLLLSKRDASYLERSPWPREVVRRLCAEVQRRGYRVRPCPLGGLSPLAVADHVRRRRFAGLVAFEIENDTLLQDLRELGLPLISVDYDAFHVGIPSAVFDNAFGTFAATKHLLSLGHRDIVALRPWLEFGHGGRRYLSPIDDQRLLGFRLAMQDAGLPVFIDEHPHEESRLREEVRRLLAGSRPPSAIVCVADEKALLVARTAIELGRHVPRDLSVVGFGDLGLEYAPGRRLTSVRLDFAEMARRAAELLLGEMEHPGAELRRHVAPAELAVHDSTGEPGRAAAAGPDRAGQPEADEVL